MLALYKYDWLWYEVSSVNKKKNIARLKDSYGIMEVLLEDVILTKYTVNDDLSSIRYALVKEYLGDSMTDF